MTASVLNTSDVTILRKDRILFAALDFHEAAGEIRTFLEGRGYGISDEAVAKVAAAATNPKLFEEILNNSLLYN